MSYKDFRDELQWVQDQWGTHNLIHKGQIVGSAWTHTSSRYRIRRDERAGWSAGNDELGVATTGAQGVPSLEEAKTACWGWVVASLNGIRPRYGDR